MPQHQGFGHLTLTVTDLERSADFYNRVLGSETALASEDQLGPFIVCMGPGFMIGLRKWEQTASDDSFVFSRVGLDHMGVHVESRDELEKWVAHLDENDVESSGIVESPFGLHLHAKDPDGIAIEFFMVGQQG
jgi:glyoxylase I family protein